MTEQPTIAQARYTVADYELAEQCVSAANVVTCDGYYEVDIEKVAETLAKARTTSLAAQDDWTAKRVAELMAEGDGHWRSCTGCHETNEGAETGDYPFNPVFKTYQGGGCGECGGIGVVWDDIDYADYAEFCLNADDDAPSLAAQDGLVEAWDDSTIDEIILNFAGGVVQVPSEHNPRGYVSYYRPREAMRKALSAIKEQHHD